MVSMIFGLSNIDETMRNHEKPWEMRNPNFFFSHLTWGSRPTRFFGANSQVKGTELELMVPDGCQPGEVLSLYLPREGAADFSLHQNEDINVYINNYIYIIIYIYVYVCIQFYINMCYMRMLVCLPRSASWFYRCFVWPFRCAEGQILEFELVKMQGESCLPRLGHWRST